MNTITSVTYKRNNNGENDISTVTAKIGSLVRVVGAVRPRIEVIVKAIVETVLCHIVKFTVKLIAVCHLR